VLKRRDDFYASRLPGPEDVLLIVEVADTSASCDRAVKIPLYAQAGIPEVWLADLPADFVGVFASPVNGRYQNIREARRGEILTLSSLAEITVRIDDLLG
jgi:Uma2 family endonuclease